MQGLITKAQVLAHPVVIVESFGVKVLVRALLAGASETFLEVVTRCAEEDAHAGFADADLARTVKAFIGFERRVGALYRSLSQRLAADPDAARFFGILSRHEEGHAIVLSRVRREIRRGRLWKPSSELHRAHVQEYGVRLSAWEEEVHAGVELPRALELVEEIEGSELNSVFDAFEGCVDMRSRAQFERFFVMTKRHLAFCRDRVAALRAARGIGAAAAG